MLSIILKGVHEYAAYLPAQEAPAQERARLPQKNGHRKRPQGSRPPQSKGQSKAERLIWRLRAGKVNKFLGRLNSALKVFAEKTESKGEIIGFQVNSEKEL